MDNRAPLNGTTRPLPPQRSLSGSALNFPKPQTRPTFPSRLSNVRSVSQPGHVVDLTAAGSQNVGRNGAAFISNQKDVVASPGVIELEDWDGERSAKRAKTEGNGFRADDGEGDGRRGAAHQMVSGDQLPGMPKTNGGTARSALPRRRRYGGEYAARKANGLESPAMATRLPPPKNVADFSPWSGHHPEDVLNEAVVKAGYCDKGPGANQTECNSAKPSIWPNLTSKNNTGLQMLSYLFTQVMEKRQTLGKCSAPSTFKPPPRVTVTDSKREAWLRDLANPDVPLRKQSRTIPHGIRGKLLMDQCLSKDIPLQRAVWLAKCVGANELRAFRRKGVSGTAAASGEIKWVREWTVHVEQFTESVIDSCGEPEWQSKMNYAVKLATGFYTEKLLDMNHFLDWIVSSLAGASIERLPIWIIMVQIYWKDIVRFVRRGRKLAESILERLHQMASQSTGVDVALKSRLQKLIAVLAVTSRGCLVVPKTWERYKYLLKPATTSATESTPESTAEILAKRNERIAGPLSRTAATTRCSLLKMYTELDNVGLDIDLGKLTETCLQLVPETTSLVSALLDWASTPYRHGLARVYLSARIITMLHGKAHDTDAAVLAYLDRRSGRSRAAELDNIYMLVGELVLSSAFAVGRYLQWLISTGALYAEEMLPATGLLLTLPASSLSFHVASLRRNILGRIGIADDVRVRSQAITKQFDGLLAGTTICGIDGLTKLPHQSVAVKVAVADYVRTYLKSVPKEYGTNLTAFSAIRRTLESTSAISALVELIKVGISTNDTYLLATITDTVVLHSECFSALGQLQNLADVLIERHRALRSQQPLDRTCIIALTDLTKLLGDRDAVLDLLDNDLAICEQQNSAAVCSPASDNVIGMRATALESADDIDAVFASGNTMDDQLLQRVFARILQRVDMPSIGLAGPASKLSSWLTQLHLVGGTSFSQVVASHARAVLESATARNNIAAGIVALVASGCIGLEAVVTAAKDVDTPQAARITAHLLLAEDQDCSGLSSCEIYRYRAMQSLCLSQRAEDLASLVITACGESGFNVEDPALVDRLLMYAASKPVIIQRMFEDMSGHHACRLAKAMIERGLPQGQDCQLDIRTIARTANALSAHVCAATLECTIKINNVHGPGTDRMAVDALREAIQDANPIWPQLVEAVSKQTRASLHDWAQGQLLSPTVAGESDSYAEETATDRYLNVLDITTAARVGEDDTAVLIELYDRLRDAEKQSDGTGMDVDDMRCAADSRRSGLRVLLHICALHTQPPATESDANRQARGKLLTGLCLLLSHPQMQTDSATTEYIFDIASALGDSLPEAVVSSIASALKPINPRVQAILGSSTGTAEAWLALASQVQPVGTAQQRALARHPSQQGQVSSRPAVAGQSPTMKTTPGLQTSQQRAWPLGAAPRQSAEMKTTPFPLRKWEIMPDPTPVMGENDTSLSLGLFGARKV